MLTWRRRVGGHFDVELLDERSGFMQLAVTGKGAAQTFKDEPGGHRWQRIPPTEKRGRVQTSTVTVAVLGTLVKGNRELRYDEVNIVTCRGTGPGGQNRNKTESCVIVTHKATKLQVRIDNERSQHQNKALAMSLMAAKLNEAERESAIGARDADRRAQVGSGMRGDKVRTYRSQDDSVTDHVTGKKWRLKDWTRGIW